MSLVDSIVSGRESVSISSSEVGTMNASDIVSQNLAEVAGNPNKKPRKPPVRLDVTPLEFVKFCNSAEVNSFDDLAKAIGVEPNKDNINKIKGRYRSYTESGVPMKSLESKRHSRINYAELKAVGAALLAQLDAEKAQKAEQTEETEKNESDE